MIRPAKVEDITGIINLGSRLLDKSPVLPSHNPLKARKALAFFISGKKSCVFVSERQGEIVGFVIGIVDEYWWSEEQYVTDVGFFVDFNHRSSGAALARRLLKWAKQFKKVKYMSLGVSSGMDSIERTGKLYDKLGFEKAGGIYTKLLDGEIQ